MYRNEIIQLEEVTNHVDEYGDVVKTSVWKEVFAEVKNITTSEFYQAHSSGLLPVYKFVINADEYDRKKNGSHIKYDDEVFRIIRTYKKDEWNLELTVEADVHVGEGV